jgi:hypothetical protein
LSHRRHVRMTQKLELVKEIIAVKIEERNLAHLAKENAEEKAKLLELLGRKKDAALESLSEEEILAKLNNL